MSKKVPLCAIFLLGVIAVVSFGFVYLVLHHHKPCKNGTCVVKIDLGHLRGRERFTVLNQKTYYSFQGIPYAKPPVDSLRFKDPEPIDHWHTVIDATKEGNSCLQPEFRSSSGELKGSEDCLYLNIYTTQFPDHDITRHPVMVYFHGGGFTYGSGSEAYYGADYLVELGVIVVTVNYRLGALGFLSLNNDDIPGNAGLKDQRLALEWIKEHISHFGGDQNSVTIFGNSAGSASVQYHMLSPLSKGLFHNAIMFSGSALNPWAFEENPINKAFSLGRILGLTTNDPQELFNFLMHKSGQEIANVQNKVRTEEDLKRCISFPFMPSVERPSPKSFLTENPKILLETGRFTRIPTIIGVTKTEGLIVFSRSDLMKYLDDDPGKLIPPDLHLDKNSAQFQDVSQRIRDFYLQNHTISLERLDEYTDLCGDVEFLIGIQKSIDYFLRNSTVPVYVDKFTFNGKFSFFDFYVRNKHPSLKIPEGPGHSDDHNYFLYNHRSANINDTDDEINMVKLMTSMMTSFATYHNPSEVSEVIWKATEENNPHYLVIGKPLDQVNDTLMTHKKVEFWDSIYKLVSKVVN